jgi:twitching motility protein PilI
MAKREAIRELQARLASRLQAARDEGLSVSWLAVRAAGRNYLLPLAQSGEIFPVAGLQRVPYAQDWFRGVVNLRGGLYGVADLARFVAHDLPPEPATAPESMLPSATEMIVVTFNAALDINCALLVGSLAGLRNPDAFSPAQGPDANAPAYFGHRFSDGAGEHWQEINLQTLCQHSRFLQITA